MTKRNSSIKCVIFDCDGILVDSETISANLLVAMSQEIGFSISFNDAVTRFQGVRLRACIEIIEKDNGGKMFPKNFEREFRARSYEVFQKELKPVDGISEILSGMRLPFCVASSGPREKIELNLQITGLQSYFNGNIFSSYEIGSWKPDPGIFLHAASMMGFEPHECVVVEDSLPGVEAALGGGFKVLFYSVNQMREIVERWSHELKQGQLIVFNQMSELAQLIPK